MYKNTSELYLLTISNDWCPFVGENILYYHFQFDLFFCHENNAEQ